MNATNGTKQSWEHLRSCQLDGLKVSETIVFAGSELCDHTHETGQICLLLEGGMRERAWKALEACVKAGCSMEEIRKAPPLIEMRKEERFRRLEPTQSAEHSISPGKPN